MQTILFLCSSVIVSISDVTAPFSRFTGHPPIVGIVSGLLILVPGVTAVANFSTFLDNNNDAGVGLAVSVLMISVALAIGVFMASIVNYHQGSHTLSSKWWAAICSCCGKCQSSDASDGQHHRRGTAQGEITRDFPRSNLMF
jgi:hypothetical protein